MKSKVTNAIELVKNSPASIFTKDDVIRLLQGTSNETIPYSTEPNDDDEVEPTITLTKSQFEGLQQTIEDILDNYQPNVNASDITDASFSFDGDRVCIDDITIELNTYELCSEVLQALEDFRNDME
jgi:hypothetical protein